MLKGSTPDERSREGRKDQGRKEERKEGRAEGTKTSTVKSRIGYPPFFPKIRPKKFGGGTQFEREIHVIQLSFFSEWTEKRRGVHNSRGYPIRVFTVSAV